MNFICKTAAELPGMNFKGWKLAGRIFVVLPRIQSQVKSKTEVTLRTDVLVCSLGFTKNPYIFYLAKAKERDRLYMLMKKRRNRAELHRKVDLGFYVGTDSSSNSRIRLIPVPPVASENKTQIRLLSSGANPRIPTDETPRLRLSSSMNDISRLRVPSSTGENSRLRLGPTRENSRPRMSSINDNFRARSPFSVEDLSVPILESGEQLKFGEYDR